MSGIGEQIIHRCFFHPAPGVHHRHPVRALGHHPHIVGNQKQGHAHALFEFTEQLKNLRLNRYVQGGCGFIGDNQPGLQPPHFSRIRGLITE